MRRASFFHLAWLLGVIAASACAATVRAPASLPPLRALPQGPGYFAGVAEADITPPLHLSLFGHGPESRIATGVRLRLRCQAFVLAAQHDVVALVPCDLQAPSLALQRAIAARLRAAGVPIGTDRLFLMATHTHAGPAHYFDARRYSGAFSSMAPGHDPRVLDFLAARIAAAVLDAFGKLGPACLGWNHAGLPGLGTHRSYVPFLANREYAASASGTADSGEDDPASRVRRAEQVRAGRALPALPGTGPGSPPSSLSPPEAAVDPSLSVLRIDSRPAEATHCEQSTPLGVFAVFGLHPTGAPNTNSLYHGDIFGFATRTAEGQLSRAWPAAGDEPNDSAAAAAWAAESARPGGRHVLVGLANGIAGDVSPKLDFQAMPEARKLGSRLGSAIASLAADSTLRLQPSGALSHLSWDLSMPSGRYDDAGHRLCPRAELGMAAAGGARDGPTRLRIIPEANAGFRPDRADPCHGNKLKVRSLDSSDYDFPRIAPVALLRIGSALLATVPGEPSTMAGFRMRSALRAGLALAKPEPIVLVGLTNQYLQYFTTAEEYAFQAYEGASTLYGPHSAQFVQRHLACLADELAGRANLCAEQGPRNVAAALDADPRPIVARWPLSTSPPTSPAQAQPIAARSREGVMGWEMELPALPLAFTSDRSQLSIAVLAGDHDEVLDDDRGASLELRELDAQRWRVRWIPALFPGDPRCTGSFRLAVRGRFVATSQAFALRAANDCAPVSEAP